VSVTSGATTLHDGTLAAPVAELLVRALELHQRTVALPQDESDAEAALVALDQLVEQLDFKMYELTGHAGSASQSSIRQQAEEELNFPLELLRKPLPPVYEAEL